MAIEAPPSISTWPMPREAMQRQDLVRVAGADLFPVAVGLQCRARRGSSRRPMTMRRGWCSKGSPCSSRAFSRGSSASTVPVPTTMAPTRARTSWACSSERGRGDPLAGAVLGGDPPVEGLGQVQRGEGPVGGPGGEPAVVQLGGFGLQQALVDVDPGGAQRLRLPRRLPRRRRQRRRPRCRCRRR